jgi:hypothetical protein
VSSIFLPDGDRFVPTEFARAMWYEDGSLNGGPVAALLARQVELVDSPNPMIVGRLTVDLLRPVPGRPLEVVTRVTRPGKRIQVVEASMTCDGVEVARASALRTRSTGIDVPEHPRRDVPPAPELFERFPMQPAGETFFHVAAVEMRVAAGDFYEHGPAAVWLRMTMPFLPEEEPSPLMRAAAFADFSNGISRVVPSSEYVFLNPDLTVYLHRYPVGEWVYLRSRTDAEPNGVALAQSELFDRDGAIGHGLQSLYLDTWAQFGGTPPGQKL